MRLAKERAAVRVPATTANMGPGFDSFGMALRYYDEVEVRPIVGTTRVHVEGAGEGAVPTGDDNLVVRALRAGLDAVGAPQAGFEMHCVNRIPHGGGMGSSASAVVAGLMLARGLLSEPLALPADEVFRIATGFEGHPDNVAPAVFGGRPGLDGGRRRARAAPMPVDGSLAGEPPRAAARDPPEHRGGAQGPAGLGAADGRPVQHLAGRRAHARTGGSS